MYQPGQITIGNFKEHFWMPLDYWNIDEYKEQWKEGIKRIKIYDSSCLIAKIALHEKELVVCAWVLYKVDKNIIFQYHFYSDEEKIGIFSSFNAKTCYEHIRPWSEVKDEFEQWAISANDFFASIPENLKQLK